jgi:hypothetical protein
VTGYGGSMSPLSKEVDEGRRRAMALMEDTYW